MIIFIIDFLVGFSWSGVFTYTCDTEYKTLINFHDDLTPKSTERFSLVFPTAYLQSIQREFPFLCVVDSRVMQLRLRVGGNRHSFHEQVWEDPWPTAHSPTRGSRCVETLGRGTRQPRATISLFTQEMGLLVYFAAIKKNKEELHNQPLK